jgi:hypothetical protein
MSLKIGIMTVLGQKTPTIKLQGYQLFDFPFPRFLHHIFFDNSASFYCRNLCLNALEKYLIEQNKKTNNNKKKLVSLTEFRSCNGIKQSSIRFLCRFFSIFHCFWVFCKGFKRVFCGSFVSFLRVLGGFNGGFLRFLKYVLWWCHLAETSSNFFGV